MDEIFSTDAAGARFLLPDGLGTTLALTDSLCSVQTQYPYEPVGKATVTGATSTNAFQYGYVRNDPMNGVDPFGLWAVQVGVTINIQLGPVSVTISGGLAIDG